MKKSNKCSEGANSTRTICNCRRKRGGLKINKDVKIVNNCVEKTHALLELVKKAEEERSEAIWARVVGQL